MGIVNDSYQMSIATDLAALRREAADPGVLQREAQAKRDRQEARHARKNADRARRGKTVTPYLDAAERRQAKLDAANARRDEAMATPLSPAMHRTMIVLAVLSALTVVGLPITGFIAYMLHAKGKAYAARIDAQRAAAAAEADRYLTAEDRDWMRRNSGQV